MRLAIAGGGTGGHLMVGIALAQHLARRDPDARVLFLCSARPLDARLLQSHGFPFVVVAGRRSGVAGVAAGVARSVSVLRWFRPSVVFSLGGFASVPAVVAAAVLGIRIAVHEQNRVAGRANRLAFALAWKRFAQWPIGSAYRSVGTPLRCGLEPMERGDARRRLGLDPDRPTIVVVGGSQGAEALNRMMPEVVGRAAIQLVHLGGGKEVRAAYARRGVAAVVMEFAQEMAPVYSAADVVITRGGGLVLWELCAFGRAAIVVPFPHARDRHQHANGRFVASTGGAVVVEEARAPRVLGALVADVARDAASWRQRGERMRGLFRPDAAQVILRELGLRGG